MELGVAGLGGDDAVAVGAGFEVGARLRGVEVEHVPRERIHPRDRPGQWVGDAAAGVVDGAGGVGDDEPAGGGLLVVPAAGVFRAVVAAAEAPGVG